jgi:hypothetical protein
VFAVRYELNLYILFRRNSVFKSRVKAGSNTSTVALQVVGGDENGILESETAKYGRESHGTQTRPLVRAPHINKPATVWQ